MNKKFWSLIVTGAVIAAGVAASGCAAQRPACPTAAAATAFETTDQYEENTAEGNDFTNENAPVADKTTENRPASFDGGVFQAANVKRTNKSAKKSVRTISKTTKKASKKTAVNNERALIVKTARADALNIAANYKNMNEKIAAAKQASAKKMAAQKNADSRKDMNKAAEEA